MSILEFAKNELIQLFNSPMFSTNSIEGWVIIFLCIWLIYEISHKAVKAIGVIVSIIFLFQVLHWFSLTSLNDIIPLSNFFAYDILEAVAQCFAGTKICDFLMWVNEYIHMVCSSLWQIFA